MITLFNHQVDGKRDEKESQSDEIEKKERAEERIPSLCMDVFNFFCNFLLNQNAAFYIQEKLYTTMLILLAGWIDLTSSEPIYN